MGLTLIIRLQSLHKANNNTLYTLHHQMQYVYNWYLLPDFTKFITLGYSKDLVAFTLNFNIQVVRMNMQDSKITETISLSLKIGDN